MLLFNHKSQVSSSCNYGRPEINRFLTKVKTNFIFLKYWDICPTLAKLFL